MNVVNAWENKALWQIAKWGDDITLRDCIGEEIPIGIDWSRENTAEDAEKRILRVLTFVSKYNSVKDLLWQTAQSLGIGPLLRSKSAIKSPDLERLRLLLEGGVESFLSE
ncbi:MAG: hypothetical protein GYA55_10530 [SAR324 cluster bacterium]|uniref:Uncharacterized protein n=1 Tax=SAR324 cluster bacterium TaxID=2024889 RepID=A0A7X9FSL7_9DELT|nr:hypothetical protein [SAR324 cluster bacterium]